MTSPRSECVDTPTTTEFESVLTPQTLAALMRSTWTWDDRALRRELSTLLVNLAAADATEPGAISDTLRARACMAGAQFTASVLGPKLIADTGNPLRGGFVDAACDPAQFGRAAAAACRRAEADAAGYCTTYGQAPRAPASQWRALVQKDGGDGLASAMRSYGHSLSDSPFYADFGLAWQALRCLPESRAAAEYLTQLEAGTLHATLAAAEQTGSWDPALVRAKATPGQDGWRISGTKLFVPAAEDADLILIVARSIAGPSLFAVHASAPGLTLNALPVIDRTRPLFEIRLADTSAVLLSTEGAAGRLMSDTLDRATIALAWEQVGLIEKAVSHLMDTAAPSDALLCELALDHAAALALARRATAHPGPQTAATAHVHCSAAAVRAATLLAEQVGSSGDTAVLLRRAIAAELLFGGPALSHERLLERLGI